MTITEDEASSLITVIEKTLREAAQEQDKPGLLVFIDQWRSDVEAGRPVERKLKVRQSPGLDVVAEVPRSRTTSSGDFIGREDFTQLEQLDMLITALGLSFLAPQMMANRVLDTINMYREAGGGAASMPDIHMSSDVGAEDGGPALSSTSIEQSRKQTRQLGMLLAEIAEAAGYEARNLDGDRGASDAT